MVNPGKKLKKILFILGITGAVYGGFRYLLPLVVPFLFAYGTALWLRPSVRFFERRIWWQYRGKTRHLPAAVIGAVEMVLILAFIAGVLYFGGSRLFAQLERFTTAIPQGLSWLDVKLTGICREIEQVLGLKDDYLVAVVREMIRELGNVLKQSSMPAIMNNSMAILSGTVEVTVLSVVYFVAVLMFLQEMEEIRERKSRSMFHQEFAMIGRRLVTVGSAWLKAELVIVSVTAAVCTMGLFFIGNNYALVISVGIGILDALPLFGAGTVLLPWGIVLFAQEQWMNGAVLLGVYVVCYFLRQILEAKIMGDKMGLTPVETLVSMYVGLKLFGLAGVLLGPIGLLLIEDFVDLYWKGEN